ncbi:MAG: ABC transporter ATP-binding protein [Acholeplasma sp.]|nr:ABC transporter ATP-binding protein [Acholeplasma sp.]
MRYIEIEQLKKYYGNKRGLESATFYVNKGEIMGFVGPNGAGKTTLIRILLGLLSKDSGNIKIEDKSCHLDQPEMNANIGYLPSEPVFFSEYTVKSVLSFYRKLTNSSPTYINELTDYFELDVTKKVKELSFGNKKKLGIVVALMRKASLLVLDEPTTGLDPLMQKKFLDYLLKEKKRGVTILLSSHVLSEVEKICDRVSLIKEGKILFSETMAGIRQKLFMKISYKPNFNLSLPGLDPIESSNGLHYKYRGDIQVLLTKLSKYPLTDLSIEPAKLEDLFLDYYKEVIHENTI